MAFPNNYRRSGKYNAKKVVVQGIRFDSENESKRWLYLQDCQRRGLISELKRQVKFILLPDEYTDVPVQLKTKVRIDRKRIFIGVYYIADFVYWHVGKGCHVVEDVKGSPDMVPSDYILKEKMMHSLKGIDIRRVYKPTEPI